MIVGEDLSAERQTHSSLDERMTCGSKWDRDIHKARDTGIYYESLQLFLTNSKSKALSLDFIRRELGVLWSEACS